MKSRGGFTLLEVLVALAVLGIAMLALLTLHDESIRSVMRGQEITRAAMLAQTIMTQAELERFPRVGMMHGDFQKLFPNEYPGYQWERIVEKSGTFPDIRKVQVIVAYGPRLGNRFSITEFMHDPSGEEGVPETQPNESEP